MLDLLGCTCSKQNKTYLHHSEDMECKQAAVQKIKK